jgi:hypothetical protein
MPGIISGPIPGCWYWCKVGIASGHISLVCSSILVNTHPSLVYSSYSLYTCPTVVLSSVGQFMTFFEESLGLVLKDKLE